MFATIVFLVLLLIAFVAIAFVVFVIAQTKEAALRRRGINVRHLSRHFYDWFSFNAPEFFWHRNMRVAWQKGVIWQGYTKRVWGYIDSHSAIPGDQVRLFLSKDLDEKGPVRGRMIAARVGRLNEKEVHWESAVDDVPFQDLNYSAASVGTWWDAWCTLTLDDSWKTGFYRFHFITEDGQEIPDVAFLVVRNPKKNGQVLLKIATATYQAYNAFGGHSNYNTNFVGKGDNNRGQLVSFDRPTFMRKLWVYDQYMIDYMESLAEQGISVDYATSYDVHADPELCEKYPLMIMTGHDEYWSKEEFDNVYRRIYELGKNTMFLCGNSVFWQIRYVDTFATDEGEVRNRQFVSMKSVRDPVRYRFPEGEEKKASLYLTARFRDAARRPEIMMTGVAYGDASGGTGDTKYPYYIADTSLPFFDGSDYEVGEHAADVIGHEWDSTNASWKLLDGVADERMWSAELSMIPKLPLEDITVVMKGEGKGTDGKMHPSEAVYFESAAGGKVFSSGTVAWAFGMSRPDYKQDKFYDLNTRLIKHMLQDES